MRSSRPPSFLRRTRARLARTLAVALLGVLSAFAGFLPPSAWGHAIIATARPTMGATLQQGDLEVRLEFNSRIDRQRSRVIVRRPDGSESLVVLTADAPPNVLAGRTQAMIAGRWKLDWQVLSVDGHITRGEVVFSVRERTLAP